MARILDKLFGSSSLKTVKLHVAMDSLWSEYDAIDEKYQEKKQIKLNRFTISANKKLLSAAKKCCDRAEYADAALGARLQSWDVKNYMNYRLVNHRAAKSIFASVKKGEDWRGALERLTSDYKRIVCRRDAYLSSLTKKRDAFVAKAPCADMSEYEAQKQTVLRERAELSARLDAEYGARADAERARLSGKIDSISSKIALRKASDNGGITLDDGVLLSVKGLKMYFGGLKAVDDLTFDVKKGEIFGLIGPNGAGKTTVFNCITRFYDATGGDMYFENKYGEVVDLRSFKVHDVILQGISRTFQNIELVKEISVLENLLVAGTRSYRTGFVAHALGLPKLKKEEKLLRAKAMRILKFMGLESYANWLAFGLPYGILKRVEIARALMADAKLIIMDEPAAGLNDSETAELTETIRRIRDEFGVTILLVEHDMSLVMNVCDTVCAISFGQMLAIGTTEQIQKNKAVQEAYLGVEDEE